MNTRMVGRWGEAVAAEYLRKKRYEVVGMNYRTRMGEVDIIAENRRYIVFVEVKTRKDDSFAKAREYVDAEKQRRILSAAKSYLAHCGTEKQPRFDVIEIYAPFGPDTKKPKIIHIENAFWEER